MPRERETDDMETRLGNRFSDILRVAEDCARQLEEAKARILELEAKLERKSDGV